MNSEDAARLRSERDASPSRWHDYDPNESLRERWYTEHPTPSAEARGSALDNGPALEEVETQSEALRRNDSHGSALTGSSSSTMSRSTRQASQASVARIRTTGTTGTNIARLDTVQRDEAMFEYLERHPTAIKRMQDHRLQHSLTVGTTRSRTGKELPAFGANKPYPKDLPDREEYVVEFIGPDDP
jgi:DHA1 family multidrug resistance protein-like MFS transporter